MNKTQEALKLAMEALEFNCVSSEDGEDLTPAKIKEAITAIREVLAEQPAYRAVKTFHDGKPVYVAEQPAQLSKPWVGLTSEERKRAIQFNNAHEALAVVIEAKLREKNA